MEQRLQWIRTQPQAWADWEPVRGGLSTHEAIARRYPRAVCYVVEEDARRARVAAQRLEVPWWRRWRAPRARHHAPPDRGVQMVWANMVLHAASDPLALMKRWHRALDTGGFLMFSTFGPDTAKELRAVYRELGWPPPVQDFTDMHDWGDMLVGAGFADPVMDMERLTLTWPTPQRLIAELREIGANLHPRRFSALRGTVWRARLEAELDRALRGTDGLLALTFEIVYGHAAKPQPCVPVRDATTVSLDDMRGLLRAERHSRR